MSIDVNLLRPLRVLLEERSVSRAAERMHTSQPSMSAALSRLRQHFGDELLRRVGNSYELTPLAERLLETSLAAVRSVDRVFAAQADFDPRTTQREFVLVGTDYSMATFGEALSATLLAEAPGVSIRFEQVSAALVSGAPESLRDVDGILHPHGYLTGMNHLDLFSDRWVCVVSQTNQRVGETLTLDDLAELRWVMPFGAAAQLTPPARQLQLLGIEPRVDVTVPSFLAVPSLVAGTDRVAFLQESYARSTAAGGRMRVLECPFEVVPFVETFWWNPVFDREPEHRWLRLKLAEAAARTGLPAPR